MAVVDSLIRREALLGRLERARPRILLLVAPAGYGKSAFISQLLDDGFPSAVVDCSGIRDDLDAARRLVSALRRLMAGEPDVEAIAARLGDGGTSVAERIDLVADVWSRPFAARVVFESAEDLLTNARDFLVRLFSALPPERRVVLASREAPRIRLSRFAAPHEILTVRAADLAFDRADIRALFPAYALDERLVARIVSATRGWPVAVLLVKRFVAEGRIAAVTDRLEAHVASELLDYLTDEILASLDLRLARAVFLCAALSHVEPTDLVAAFRDPRLVEDLTALSKEWPFLECDERGAFRLHPLLVPALLQHAGEERERLLREVAREHVQRGDMVRAAEVFVAVNDVGEAARTLERHEVIFDPHPLPRYRSVLRALDRSVIARAPRLWAVMALSRLFTEDMANLLDEADTLWRTLPEGASPVERAYVLIVRVICMTHLGMLPAAQRIVDEFFSDPGVMRAPELESVRRYLRGIADARSGKLAHAERELNGALALGGEIDIIAAGSYLALGAEVARVRGEASLERQLLSRATERAQAAEIPALLAICTAESLIGAWLSGDMRTLRQFAEQLDTLVAVDGARCFSYLASIALGRIAEPSSVDLPRYVAAAKLIEATRTREKSARSALAEAARTYARKASSAFFESLANIALDLPGEACAAASRCESPALAAAVAVISGEDGDLGMLEPFIAQLRRDDFMPAPATVSVLGCTVRIDDAPARLPGREMELIAALAVRREPVLRSRLAATLWPDLDETAARNALSVCLHRLRAHLGRDDIVVREADGYRLHHDARVDLWEIERTAALARSRDLLTASDRAAFRRTWELLEGARDERLERWEWFAPTRRRLEELRLDIGHRLAFDALDRGDTRSAREYADAAIAGDPCDETAREVAILALLRDGDRAAAVRQFRQYRVALLEELGVEPSAKLAALVAE
jgi:DNA-binding SARP family transcriptional activator